MSIRSSGPLQSRRSGLVEQHPLACFLVLTYFARSLWGPLVIFRDALPPRVGFTLCCWDRWCRQRSPSSGPPHS